ncbi:MAG: ROK family glucokinase [Lachnospiraceae bacterium]|nr:ROK family glucokinase [Lachnospiraceae bacterium]MBR6486255.1 ROK family glucokinase [Lachnospiraceae bacterium]
MDKYCFAADIGGTTIKMGLFSPDGDIVNKWEIPTNREDNGSHILKDIADAVKKEMEARKLSKDDVLGIGVGAPGPVDKDGVIHKAVNLGWGVLNISEELSALTGMTVKAGNDANVAALGEMWKGGGEGFNDLVVVTLGTGVGGGVIIDGKIVTGCMGAGGEIGHIHVEDDEDESCGCGNKGCLEQYASATGIVRLAEKKLKTSDKDSVLRTQEVNAKTVFDAVKASDPLAMEIAEEFGEYLGKGLANIACVTNPEVFVIGGGVSKAGPVIIDYVEKYYKKFVFHASRDARFKLATLGNDAGICGAARLLYQ